MTTFRLCGPAARLGIVDSQGDSFLEECDFECQLPIPLVDNTQEVTFGQVVKVEKSLDNGAPILYVEAEIADEHTKFISGAVAMFGLRFAVNGFVQHETAGEDGKRLIDMCLVKSIGLCSRNADYFLKNVSMVPQDE